VDDFRSRLKEDTLLCDGAMGTTLQASSLKAGQAPEILNLENPDEISRIHRAFADAGADIIETNSFGGNRIKLSAFGLEDKTEQINRAAVKIAQSGVQKRAYIAGSVGPTGRFLSPVGDMDFDEAFDVFYQQIGVLADEGAHLIILETFTDIKELRAAIIAARSLGDIPVVATMSFEPNGKTLLGSSPEAAAVTLEALGIDAVGANCGLGPEGILQVLRGMAAVTELPLASQPNAGMPRLVKGETVFPSTPEDMTVHTEEFLEIGVGILGGCCGNTPAHISRMRESLDTSGPRSPRTLTNPAATRLSCRESVLFLGGNGNLKAVGERLNPTGRKILAESVKSGNLDLYRDEARRQVEAGAHMLDVNVGVPGIDESRAMHEAVLMVQQSVAVPLSLDSPMPDVIEAGLKVSDGKVLINSVTGEEESMKRVLPLARKYGAAVLGLTLDEKGIPAKSGDRLKIARRILDRAVKEGLKSTDVMIDCLTLSAGAEQESVFETVKALKKVRKELGLNTLLGISNVSFGLPARENLNAAFLAMAASEGLSAAIVNPFHSLSMGVLAASRVITNQDPQAREYIRIYSKDTGQKEAPSQSREPSREESLREAVIEGSPEQARKLSGELLDTGTPPMDIGEKVLIPAMSEVGEKFASNEYFLPQVIMSAKAMKAAFEPIRARLKGEDLPSRGRIMMATVEGDIHDIGKNIVITLLENHAFEVIDLGKNISAEEIVKDAIRNRYDAVGLSALMTTTMVKMKEAVQAIREAGLEIPVVVGGAAVTSEFADEIGAAGYAQDATQAVAVFLDLVPKGPGG
jgi:5-methyltetrahydrofolate--homocysteine methyltransferase